MVENNINHDGSESDIELRTPPNNPHDQDERIEEDRRRFLFRKTFRILGYQFGFTFLMVLLVAISESVRASLLENYNSLLTVSIFGSTGTILFAILDMANFDELILGVFTIFETIIICLISSLYTTQTILIAFIATFGLSAGLISYGMTTTKDHTGIGRFLRSGLTSLVFMGFVNMFFLSDFLFRLDIYGGVLLFMGYIIYDVQLYFRKVTQVESNTHILAAVNIYLDIINIFVRLLEIISNMKNEKNKKKDN